MHGLETIVAMNTAKAHKAMSERVTDLAERVRNFGGKLSNIAWALDEAARNARLGNGGIAEDDAALKAALAVAETTLHDMRLEGIIP
jgi:hypothetical protein